MVKLALQGRVAATALLLTVTAGSAFANAASPDELKPITVTATRTGATDLQKTPIAISVFTARDIRRLNLSDVAGLQQYAPSLRVSQNGAFAEIYIRGIGSNNVFNGADPSVTMNLDGVYIGRPFAQFADFLDVERVEVLRGPQGTLYGRNAIGGTINIITRLPTDQFHARVQAISGNYGLGEFQGVVSGALVPGKVDASFAASYTRHDPYSQNVLPGHSGANGENQGGARAQVRVLLSPQLQAITRIDASDENDTMGVGNVPFTPIDPLTRSIIGDYHKIDQNTPVSTKLRTAGISEEIDFSPTPNLHLKSLTAYRNDRLREIADPDATDVNALETHLGSDQHQFSQEFDLHGLWERLKYVTGLYYIREAIASDNFIFNHLAKSEPSYQPHTIDSAWAVFAQGDYSITERLTATIGARYTGESKSFAQNADIVSLLTGATIPGFPVRYKDTHHYDAFTPKFGLSYTLHDLMLYVSATRGFKSGGFNMSSTFPDQGYGPEKLWSYEVGLKSDLVHHTVQFNLTGFYYDYKDLQVQNFIVPGTVDITNAATATDKGIEIDAIWEPIPRLLLSANGSWLDARYERYIEGTVNYSHHYLNDAPPYTVNFGAKYTWLLSDGALTGQAHYSAFGKTYYAADNLPLHEQTSYGLLGASVDFHPNDGHWDISVWGENLTDRQYVSSLSTIGPFTQGLPGNPRTYGVKLGYTW